MLKEKLSFHNSLVDQLKRLLISKNIPSAYIFSGTDGSGRDFLARMFAKTLLCEAEDLFFCGTCQSCKLVDADIHPGLLTVSEYKVENFKEITHNVYKSPLFGKNRVYIFERCENFNLSCANSILKVLEEPPENLFFLLTAQNLGKVIPTIKSRCFKLNANPDGPQKSMNYDLYYMIGETGYQAFISRIDHLAQERFETALPLWKELFNEFLSGSGDSEPVGIAKLFYSINAFLDVLLDQIFNGVENIYSLLFILSDQLDVIRKSEIMKKNRYLNFENDSVQRFLEKLASTTMSNNSLTMNHRKHIINKVKKGLESLFLNINKELILLDVIHSLKNENIGSYT